MDNFSMRQIGGHMERAQKQHFVRMNKKKSARLLIISILNKIKVRAVMRYHSISMKVYAIQKS